MADAPWLQHYKGELAWDMRIPPHPVYNILDNTAAKHPDHIAIDFLGKKTTYKELLYQVNALANSLLQQGIGKGTKVGILLPNCPQQIISYYAILKSGATVVNLNPLYTIENTVFQVNDAQVDTIITVNLGAIFSKIETLQKETLLKRVIVTKFQSELPILKRWLFPILRKKHIANITYSDTMLSFEKLLIQDSKFENQHIDSKKDIALLQYTGGTTGKSKGAMLTHANVYINAVQAAAMCTNMKEGEERVLAILPFFHIFAMTAVLNVGVIKASTLILHPRFDIRDTIKDIRKKKITILPAVPTMFVAINHYRGSEKRNLSSIKMGIAGGAGLPLVVKEEFEQLSGAEIYEGYGLTESSPVATLNPPFAKNKPGSIGIPLPHTTIEIADLENRDKLLQLGETGEICISGPQVMQGYWHADERDDIENPIHKGRLYTGDVGYIDEEGYIHIVDRIKDMIISGGMNIYPRNIEEKVIQHPAIQEVAVIAAHDDYKGQVVKACVTLKQGQTLKDSDLIAFLKPLLAKFELPKYIVYYDELPKTLIGKTDKKTLKELEDQKEKNT